mmetsp:Transcript_22876/g.52392  ORF Transcript_22876/g.52392 Transcript_22876/m.52392 type:complete len:208 (-) Transcript_22876:803-1426(-)
MRFLYSTSISAAAWGSSSLRRKASLATCTAIRGNRFLTSATCLAAETDHVLVLFSSSTASSKLPTEGSKFIAASALSKLPSQSCSAVRNSPSKSLLAPLCRCKAISVAALSGSQFDSARASQAASSASPFCSKLLTLAMRSFTTSSMAGTACVKFHRADSRAQRICASDGRTYLTKSSLMASFGSSFSKCDVAAETIQPLIRKARRA